MAELITQFEKACSNVEPSPGDVENAAKAHKAVREVLGGDAELTKLGIDTVLIGSYKRHVSIRRVKDVDVLSRTDGLTLTGPDALDLWAEVLGAEDAFGDRVERQDRSIKVDFPEFDLHVDAVPARPCGTWWEIPDPDGDWTETNPEALTTLSSAMNAKYDDVYVPIVKLIRQARRTHLEKRPGGLFFEILTYHAFDSGLSGENLPQLFVSALRGVADQLQAVVAGGEVDDPTMPGKSISVRVTDMQMATAASRFEALAKQAEEALAEEDVCVAASAYRHILGKNADDEWVFPMPATCEEDGTRKLFSTFPSTATAGDSHVPAGNRRFA